ncbi:MAG: hypothetical protein FWG65_04175 [Turicibacter sp.]|nr:hypothetical protein [Turicibacter sp.]
MQITRYDGTRFITEEEIDREFTDYWVLVATEDAAQALRREGMLIASVEGDDEYRQYLSDIAIDELNSNATIIYGCKERGGSLHVEILG